MQCYCNGIYVYKILKAFFLYFTVSVKAYDAADFSEINELADDEETNYKRGLNFVSRNVKGMYQYIHIITAVLNMYNIYVYIILYTLQNIDLTCINTTMYH